jgi:hypothetical protein
MDEEEKLVIDDNKILKPLYKMDPDHRWPFFAKKMSPISKETLFDYSVMGNNMVLHLINI